MKTANCARLALGFVAAFCCSAQNPVANCSESQYAELLNQLESATAQLQSTAAAARAQYGIDTTYENITAAVAGLFTSVIIPADQQQRNNNGVTSSYTAWLSQIENRSASYIHAELTNLPCNESMSMLEAVSAAQAALKAVIADPASRKPVPSNNLLATAADWSATDGLLHTSAGNSSGSGNSSVVYPSSWCYALCPMGFPAAQVPQITAIAQNHAMDYVWVPLSDALLPSPGTVNATEVDRIVATAVAYQQQYGVRVHMFIEQRVRPSWVAAYSSDLADAGGNHDVSFNMDSPAAQAVLWQPVLQALMPKLMAALSPPPLSYMVCNECVFESPSANATGSSMAAFRAYLSAEYNGSIAALNHKWGTSITSFDAITTYPPKPSPSSLTPSADAGVQYVPYRKAAAWWDYTQWARYRVTRFFSWLAHAIRQYHPGALLHQKTMNEASIVSGGDDGLDRDAFARTLGIVGCDTNAMAADSVPHGGATFSIGYWVPGRYAWDWRPMAMSYTLMRAFGRVHNSNASTAGLPTAGGLEALSSRAGPGTKWLQAPAFDSETHEQSTFNKRTHDTQPSHSTAVGWLLHVSGIAAHSIWYWGRDENGGVATGAFPKVADELLDPTALSAQHAAAKLLQRQQQDAAAGNTTSTTFPYTYAAAPAALDAVARTQAAINTAADAVAYLATGEAPALPGFGHGDAVAICVLYSVASKVGSAAPAQPQPSPTPPTHMSAMLTMFEAASFYGAARMMFVTEQQMAEGGGDALTPCAALLLPATGFVGDTTVAAVDAWIQSTGNSFSEQIIAVPSNFTGTGRPPSTADTAFGCDEWGTPRAPSALNVLNGAQTLLLDDPQALYSSTLQAQLELAGVPRLVRTVNVTAGNQGTPFGVLLRWAVEEGGATVLVWLLNVTPDTVQVTLQWDDLRGGLYVTQGTDVLTGANVTLGAAGLPLATDAVLFLRLAVPT